MTARAINTSGLSQTRAPRFDPGSSAWGSRLLARLVALAEAWAEARELARAAHRRYPFVDW